GSNVYHHPQPFWFYVPILLLSLMPWTLWFVLAVVERARLFWSERRTAVENPDDAWQMFLVIWLLVFVVFFSASQSKLPGYILPAVPAGALLVNEYIGAHRNEQKRIPLAFAWIHGLICWWLVIGALTAALIQQNHSLVMTGWTYVSVAIALLVAFLVAGALL